VKHKDLRPWLSVIVGGESLVSHAGGVLLVETARRSGLSGQLSRLLGRWRKPLAIHDPGKIVTDLAIAVALGGDAAADIALLRAQPGVFGAVASDPTVSRLISTLAEDADPPWPRSTPRGQWRGKGSGTGREHRYRTGGW
jgi:Transposase DDE domain group 1